MSQLRVAATLPSRPPPDPLVYEADGAQVVRGDDAGDFYCEHVYYMAGRAAIAPGSSVVKDREGEPLIGFLHVPGDPYTETTLRAPADRHDRTRAIVGAALSGFIGSVPSSERTVRVLLTGFGPFDSIINNPTGDFVINKDNVDAAMRTAYGVSGTVVATSPRGQDLAYDLPDGRRVIVRCVRLPVDDTTIDGKSSWSIQRLYGDFRPQAALHLGVATGETKYRAEFHADNGGLAGDHHADFAPATDALPDNFALERVLRVAGQWQEAAAAIVAAFSRLF
jgi:pyrrolidone-carboxylate peptidase